MRRFSLIIVPIGLVSLLNVVLSAQPLVNLGLVGVGRIPANSFDALGTGVDTMGGIFSGMALDLRNNQTNLYALPDRGFGDGTNDYHNRIQVFGLNVQPYYGPFPAGAQNQINFTLQNTMILTIGGATFTGFNANDTNVAAFPQSPADSPGKGHRSLDSEGVAFVPSDDGFFIADEYGPFIYRFDFIGQFEYELRPPDAYIPKSGADFGSRFPAYGTVPPQNPTNDSGRFYNRGFEGLSLTPDGKKLVTILQVPLQQDGGNRNTSRNTRILIFDVDSSSATFKQPIGEYIYELTLQGSETGNRNTPVSELLALSDTQFLVLERESRGRGGDPGPILYKKVVKADISQSTNLLAIAGTPYDLEKGAPGQSSLPANGFPLTISRVPPFTITPAIKPAVRTELVDLADTNQLARFGLNANTNWDENTISEKWEGLAILPLNDPAAPNDFLLLVGNDNDFRASTVYHNGVVVGTNALTIDSMMLAFRIGQDRTPPVIVSCPTNIVRLPPPPVSPSRPGDPTTCRRGLYSLSSLVTATDNSAAPLSFIQTPPPGTTLELDTPITITIVAVDAAGNQSEPCSFVVIFGAVHPFFLCPSPVTNAVGSDCLATVPDFIANTMIFSNCSPYLITNMTQEPAAGTKVPAGIYTVLISSMDSGGIPFACETGFTALGAGGSPLGVAATAKPATLWPPNHKMVPVSLNVSVTGGCGAIQGCEVLSVTSNEPIMSLADRTSPDWQITGPLAVKLRAERPGSGDRVYTISIRCTDSGGNSVITSTTVTVPHDQGSSGP